MKNIVFETYAKIKSTFFTDKINRYLLLSSALLFLVAWLVWRNYLVSPDLYVYYGFGLYPVEYLALIYLINTFMSYFSYDKEKEIGYLLMSSNVFIGFLILALEIFYLTHR